MNTLPKTRLADKVFDMVKAESPEYLLNHCARSYLFAKELAQKQKIQYNSETLFLACLMHDLGFVPKYYGKTRFEVDGADAAAEYLRANGADEPTIEIIWNAVALHTTTHIPLRKGGEIALLQIGAAADVMGLRLEEIEPERIKQILESYPRKNFKESLLNDMIAYLKENPSGGNGYWLGQVAEKHVPGAPHFNFEFILKAAPFPE